MLHSGEMDLSSNADFSIRLPLAFCRSVQVFIFFVFDFFTAHFLFSTFFISDSLSLTSFSRNFFDFCFDFIEPNDDL